MTQLLSAVGIASSARAGDSGAAPEPLRVTIVAEAWGAPFGAAELASAVRLRLPRAEVTVAAAAPEAARSPTSITVRWLAEPSGLRVERGGGDAVEFPLAGGARAGGDAGQLARRSALAIALFADEGAPPGEGATAGLVAPWAAPPAGEAAGASASVPPPPVAPPGPPGASPERAVPAAWSVGGQLGPAFTVETDEIQTTVALTVRARRWAAPSTAIELGVKLSGEYSASLPSSQAVAVADRAFFAGVAYEAWLSPRLAIDLDAALQYTYPVTDIDGDGPVQELHAPASSRLAVRTGIGLAWSPRPHLVVGISAATAFSFREREFVDDSGAEVIGLGSMTLDLTAGAGVRW